MTTQPEPTIEQRRVIYQARRGLKELDFYIDPYVKQNYLLADADEQETFAKLLTYEDPDLLNFFMNQDTPDNAKVAELVAKLKQLQHG
ncbi:succinate dehydrogenase assembly factor 2 [Psychrobacter sp. FDAARGOS_221]|uniref:FAD assembly factor SdhE n=1 Tax=Psychrobacter sp. FDAARGOS_221 TaxID=1975705 RepID=UPI000BB543A1|nr:succinate dehydrogenase assembly factor 2 [Psychrobacter sp. FDAARGOS_221]PNK60227.1 succinate dehydrogenase assembly factor 2 [Psychrobacter sp. FDAARGOS_221]